MAAATSGIIGALASILASILIPAPKKQFDPTEEIGELKTELAAMHGELTAIRELLTVDEQGGVGPARGTAPRKCASDRRGRPYVGTARRTAAPRAILRVAQNIKTSSRSTR